MSEDEGENVRGHRSARRPAMSSQKADRLKALQAMKDARNRGQSYRRNVDDLVKDVYEVVGEDEYNDIVQKRQRDDFVVDDDGSGYVDHGVDFLDEDDDVGQVEKKKKEKKSDKAKKGGLTSFFSSANTVKKTKTDESKVNIDDDDDLKDILKDIEDEPMDDEPAEFVSKNPFKRERASSPDFAPRPVKAAKLLAAHQRSHRIASTSSAVASSPSTRQKTVPEQKSRIQSRRAPSLAPVPVAEDSFENEDYGITMDTVDDIPILDTKKEAERKKEPVCEATVEPGPEVSSAKLTISKEHMFTTEDWTEDGSAATPDSSQVQSGEETFYTKDAKGTPVIRMCWLDAYEDSQKHAGKVYLFGRVETRKGVFESCCLVANNIPREVFFIPRETILHNGVTTNVPVTMKDVYDEVKDVLRDQFNITNFRCRPWKRRLMNCENGGEPSEEMEVLEVQYESSNPRIPAETSGRTFRYVANTTTTALERLLVERDMMGPGWIEVAKYEEVTAQTSYCKYEFNVDMDRMKSITYLKDQATMPLPTCNMLALNVITTLNDKKENEICMISCLFNPRCNLNNPSTEQKFLQRFCIVTKPPSGALPFDLKDHLKRNRLETLVHTAVNERVLLNMFLTKIQSLEPDVILGHDISATIARLMGRLEKHKVPNWSRTSRLKRSATLNKIGHSKAAQWEITAGRLLVDSKTSAMELVRCRSYELAELASSLLKVEHETMYANEVASKYSSSQQLLNLINWSWLEPWMALRIVAQLNALPLALQITNIVGGVTSRTLMGGRAERNEYLLLHAFKKVNIIPPNKHQPTFLKKGSKKKEVALSQESHVEDETEGNGKTDTPDDELDGRKKAQYSGGLVLEPKKGLYDTLILLLDFNSLYPSIIQEYNICFSTVRYIDKDGGDLPELPDGSLAEGILPQEIRGLVERRRQVKQLVKSAKNEMQRKQFDIRQTALKLTANSMYGCLGFQQSRFYAKPLAALVTAKGREILMHTKDLVEKLGYSVVYGDTDSIMINTNSNDLKQAKKLGFEIKKQVNQCHRLLELELDGVFKRMLLLKKKKYAALTVNVDDENDTKKELKGLDIVRRDWSMLAKEQGGVVVDLILDPKLTREELASEIDDSLKGLREKLDAGKVEMEQFEILKQLTRDPKDYHDVKSQPHVAVARRLNNSGKFHLKQGDIVKYIVCEDGSTNSAMQRAYHRTELENNSSLKVDIHYYLAQQVHPVVSRLCAPIEETDAVRIAEALGMDATSYRRSAAAQNSQSSTSEEELMWRGLENYDNCQPLVIVCPNSKCGNKAEIRAAITVTDGVPTCPLEVCASCGTDFVSNTTPVLNNLNKQLSEFVEKFSRTEFVCDDQTCGYRTRVHSMRWCKEGIECPKCTGGIMKKEYSEKELFEQQTFFKNCFDFQKAVDGLEGDAKLIAARYVLRLQHIRTNLCERAQNVCDRFLEKNAYSRVSLAFLFAPMCKLK